MTLYHYTCDHGLMGIGQDGWWVKPLSDVMPESVPVSDIPQCQFAWFTDLDVPNARGLGLTSLSLSCDRTKHRLRVTDATEVERWLKVRRYHRNLWPLELAPGALPAHWWIAVEPVPVERAA